MYIYAYLLHLYSYTNSSPPHPACLACYSFAHYSLVLCTSHAYLCVCIVVTSLHHTAIHLHIFTSFGEFVHLVQYGLNALHLAAQGRHSNAMKFLSPTFGARIRDGDNNDTMLHWAAYSGHCEVVHCLIKEFAMDPQDRDKVCGK